MNKILLTLAGIALLCSRTLADSGYHYHIDLNKVQNDKITVTLTPPDLGQQEVEFLFPAMVPGTYEVYDFGRFITNFRVVGKNGKPVKFEKVNVNTYRINPASDIEKIMYEVDDTFDKADVSGFSKKIVFEPGGSNFEAQKNFSFNTHCLFGYFRNMTSNPFTLVFDKPQGFYPATGLTDLHIGASQDTIRAAGYHLLVDSPILYAKPDTASVEVAQTKVLVATYGENHKISADFIASTLKELLAAQQEYLGGTLPVNKYAFLFFFTAKPTLSGASGALEHSYSSFYVMPEFEPEALRQQIRDVAAHEFFHIVTPLSIHSKEIGDFDFNDPKMSEHLWMYEGMTEYAAHHAQVKAGLIDVNEFLNVMMQKYQNSLEQFNDTMSFTYMSKHVLEEKIHPQYGNVYEKGAVIGMCLDILLRDMSNGTYGTQNLMRDLSTKYGKDRSFDDAQLFNDIEKLTYPEIGAFLRNHVGGHQPLPMADVLGRIGILFSQENTSEEFTLGNPDLDYNAETNRLVVAGIKNLDPFGKALGYKKGDELWKLNGRELKVENVREAVAEYYENLKAGDQVKILVYRPKKLFKHKYTQKTLAATAQRVEVKRKNQIAVSDNVTDKQKLTLKAWLGLHP